MSLKRQFLLLFIFLISCASFAQDSNITLLSVDSYNVIEDTCAEKITNADTILTEESIADELVGISRQEDRREAWFFYVVIFQIVLLAIVKWFFSKQIEMARKSFFNLNLAAYQFREERGEGSVFKMLLNINFILSLSLLSVSFMQYFEYKPPLLYLYSFFIVLFALSLVYILKYLQYLLIALVFPVTHTAQFFQFVYFAVMRVLGVVLVPVNLLLYYSSREIYSPLFYGALLIFLCFILFRIARGLSISQSLIIQNKVHFFLYICTLEIVPVLLLVKFLRGFFE